MTSLNAAVWKNSAKSPLKRQQRPKLCVLAAKTAFPLWLLPFVCDEWPMWMQTRCPFRPCTGFWPQCCHEINCLGLQSRIIEFTGQHPCEGHADQGESTCSFSATPKQANPTDEVRERTSNCSWPPWKRNTPTEGQHWAFILVCVCVLTAKP